MTSVAMSELDLSRKMLGVDKFMQDVVASRQRYYDATSSSVLSPAAAGASYSNGGGPSVSFSMFPAQQQPYTSTSSAGDGEDIQDGCSRCRHIRNLQQSLRAVEDGYMSEIDELRQALRSADLERMECTQLYEASLGEVDRLRSVLLSKDKDLTSWRSRALQADEELRIADHRRGIEADSFQRNVAYFHEREVAYTVQGELAGRIEVANIEACWRSAIVSAAHSEHATAIRTLQVRRMMETENALRDKERTVGDNLPATSVASPSSLFAQTVSPAQQTAAPELQRPPRAPTSDDALVQTLRKEISSLTYDLRCEQRLCEELQNELNEVATSEVLLQEALERSRLEGQDQKARLLAIDTLSKLRIGWAQQQLRRVEDERLELQMMQQSLSSTAKAQSAPTPAAPPVLSSAVATTVPADVEKELKLLRRLYTEEKEALFEARKALQELQQRCDSLEAAAAAAAGGVVSAAETPMMTPAKEQPSPRVVQTFDEQESLPVIRNAALTAPPNFSLPPPFVPTSVTSAPVAAAPVSLDPSVIAAAVAQALEAQFAHVNATLRRLESHHEELFGPSDPPLATDRAAARDEARVLAAASRAAMDDDIVLTDVPSLSLPAALGDFRAFHRTADDFNGEIDVVGAMHDEDGKQPASALSSDEQAKSLRLFEDRPSASDGRAGHRSQRLPSFCSRLVQELREVSAMHRSEVVTAVEVTQEESMRHLAAQFEALHTQQERSEKAVEDKLAAVRSMVRNLMYTTTHNQKLLGNKVDTVAQIQSSVHSEVAALLEQTSSLGSTLERQTSSFFAMAPTPNFARPESALSASSGGPLSIKSPEASQSTTIGGGAPPAGASMAYSDHGGSSSASHSNSKLLPQPLTSLLSPAEHASADGRGHHNDPRPAPSRERRPSHQWDDEVEDEDNGGDDDADEVLRAMKVLSGSQSSTYAVSPMSAPKAKPSPKVTFATPYD